MDLSTFQRDIARTFGEKDARRGIPGTFMYFTEEVGELAEALREPAAHDLPGNSPTAWPGWHPWRILPASISPPPPPRSTG